MKGTGRQAFTPDGYVDCGAPEPVCPVEAIYCEVDVPAQSSDFTPDNARFFVDPLPGADAPWDSPGGAAELGRIGADTELVAGRPGSR